MASAAPLARPARLLLALLLAAGVPAAAQGVVPSGDAQAKPGAPSGPSVFGEVPGGGQYLPPGDAGGPGGDDDDDGGSGGDGGASTPGHGGLPQASRPVASTPGSGLAAPADGQRGGSVRGLGGSAPETLGATGDRWDLWWETNKFDFIELHRVEDAPVSGQGTRAETPAERELRLAAVRTHVRERVLPVVRELLDSPDEAVRGAAAVTLGKLRDAESLDALARLLGDGSLAVRRSAMLALGVAGHGRGSWMLMHVASDSRTGRQLLHSDPVPLEDRGTALLAATLRGDPAATRLVVELLSDRAGTPTPLLALAADAAGLLDSSEPLRPLIDVAFDRSLPEYARSAATSALGRLGDPSVTPALIELLDSGLEPRRAATLALGLVAHPGATRVIERLAQLLEHDQDAATRHFAAISLGRIGGQDARAALLARLPRADGDLRPWLALGLGLCERSQPAGDIAPLLVERLADEPSAEARGALLIALGLTRSPAAQPAILGQLRGGSAELAGYAAMALGLCGLPDATVPLREVLARSTDPRVLRQAAFALGLQGDAASIPALLDLIRTTSNPFVASFAAIGTAFLGDAEAAGPLLDMIQREGPTGVTTTWAVAAVGQLFDLDRRPALSRLAAGDNYLVRQGTVSGLLALGF